MSPVIEQRVTFNSTPEQLYELFMDSAKHTAATGVPAKISRKVGGKWSAFQGALTGRNLELVPNETIVQAWRSTNFKKEDPDSILIVRFEKALKGATVHLTHVGVPKQDYRGVTKGWKKFYWDPWKKYLKTF
jgi:activator of HSP90 ATPase